MRTRLGRLLTGKQRQVAVPGLHGALVVRAHGVRHEEPHLLETLEGVVAVEFRLPVRRKPPHVPLVGLSARPFRLLNFLGGSA
jgi:hypothetical protein